MKYPRVDSGEARLLVRSLGLLLNQAAVYGPVHNVTKTATSRVYNELKESLKRYGVLEFTVKSNLICLNGFSEDLDSSVSSNLVKRFAQIDITGVLFINPVPERDFERSIKILAQPVASLTESSGIESLLLAENIKSVSVVDVDYRRVDSAEEYQETEPAGDWEDIINSSPAQNEGVFDISADLMTSGDLDLSPFRLDSQDADNRAEAIARRKAQSDLLADLLRKTADSLESNIENPQIKLGRVVGALETMRSSLLEMSRDSQMAITSLARDVDEDKDTVAGLEADAERCGVPLKLTREDLIDRYAELTQEIVQPLTVSTGVIEMLRKHQAGTVTGQQEELLKMAHESIDRVNELVNYIHAVTGLPDSFQPNSAIINDSYISKAASSWNQTESQ